QINGTIIPNDDKWIYNLLDMDSTAPSDIVLPDNNEPLDVEVNSGGGDVFSGSEIYTALRGYQGDVNVNIVGIAGSAASVIAMAGNKVSISPTAQIMIHNVSGGTAGDYREHNKFSEILQKGNDSTASAYMAKTGKDLDELLNLMNEETWLTAEEAKEQGFADEIMFSNDKAPKMVASASPVIPQDVIERLTNAMKPNFSLDELADKVTEKIEAKQDDLAKNNQQNNEPNKEPEAKKTGFARFFF
ncbi:head maturation protease, ClpP-related, partial [Tetragenococcus halophilus]|uniref:head maturation protease, ClpP-related n=1 Tax=Tetragenococcus halophilus TaxID=51669 RepID=UPI0030F0E032